MNVMERRLARLGIVTEKKYTTVTVTKSLWFRLKLIGNTISQVNVPMSTIDYLASMYEEALNPNEKREFNLQYINGLIDWRNEKLKTAGEEEANKIKQELKYLEVEKSIIKEEAIKEGDKDIVDRVIIAHRTINKERKLAESEPEIIEGMPGFRDDLMENVPVASFKVVKGRAGYVSTDLSGQPVLATIPKPERKWGKTQDEATYINEEEKKDIDEAF
jgi:hypothetical protein